MHLPKKRAGPFLTLLRTAEPITIGMCERGNFDLGNKDFPIHHNLKGHCQSLPHTHLSRSRCTYHKNQRRCKHRFDLPLYKNYYWGHMDYYHKELAMNTRYQ